MHLRLKLITAVLFVAPMAAHARDTINDCSAKLVNDTLTVENNYLQYKWLWNEGEIIPFSIEDKLNGKSLTFANKTSDCKIEQKQDNFVKNIDFKINHIDQSYMSMEALEVEIVNQYADFQQKRVIRVFPNTPTISFDNAFKYERLNTFSKKSMVDANGDKIKLLKVLDYQFNQKHWRYETVRFVDMTDHNNNLVFDERTIPYKGTSKHNGNLLWAENLLNGFKFFVLKEAPNGTSQIAYPGYDFEMSWTSLSIPISGVENSNDGEDFIPAYTITLGVPDEKTNGLTSLRKYLKQSVPYETQSHDMILMNTWGDRGQDGRISEEFITNELNLAAELGITHFQIDDGWQQGASRNSSFKDKNRSWDDWSMDNWMPNKERFPNGLEPIVKLAKKKNIKLGLWFNPSKANDYAGWERDAEVITNLYKKYGIRYYKLDGVAIPTKKSAINFEKFLKSVKEQTNGAVFFNLDLTAGVRGGYFSYRYAGNLFLENRYTDFKNYYPYSTLRNLWMLSHYFPPELLQIEFLNKWRNVDFFTKDDVYAASHYDLDYMFALTMVAQPLAWFEAERLPEEAFEVGDLIKKYRSVQTELHSGTTLPIGDEPCGCSWTGFQTILDDESGFFMIIREDNDQTSAVIETYLDPSSKVQLTPVVGDGSKVKCEVDGDKRIKFNLDKKNSFVLYKYKVIK